MTPKRPSRLVGPILNLFRGSPMRNPYRVVVAVFRHSCAPFLFLFMMALASPAFAQAGNSPWENAVNVLQTAFTSTIARGLSLVAIVVSGLTFAFGEGGW